MTGGTPIWGSEVMHQLLPTAWVEVDLTSVTSNCQHDPSCMAIGTLLVNSCGHSLASMLRWFRLNRTSEFETERRLGQQCHANPACLLQSIKLWPISTHPHPSFGLIVSLTLVSKAACCSCPTAVVGHEVNQGRRTKEEKEFNKSWARQVRQIHP